MEAQVPLRLRENDIITMGNTDLQVHISNIDDTPATTDDAKDNNDEN